MTTRTDIHRPSSTDFDPQDYTYIAAFDLSWKPSIESAWTAAFRAAARTDLLADMLKNQGATWAEHRNANSRKCGHCGTRIQYAAIMLHNPTKEIIEVGETCLNGRFNLSKIAFTNLRKASAARRASSKNAEQRAAILEAHPELVAAMESDNSFIQDVMRRFKTKAELSEKQIAAVKTALVRDAERAEREAVWATEAELAADAPTGKVTVTGEIVSTKWQETMYGSTQKMIVKTEAGWKLWVTVPSSIEPTQSFTDFAEGKAEDKLEGKTVTLTATVTPSNDDPKFAFGKRPTQAKLVS
jgi:hypothetical protein